MNDVIEEARGRYEGDVVPMVDYNEGCLCVFLRTVGLYWKCAAEKYDYLNTGGNFSFFVLYSRKRLQGGCMK